MAARGRAAKLFLLLLTLLAVKASSEVSTAVRRAGVPQAPIPYAKKISNLVVEFANVWVRSPCQRTYTDEQLRN